MVEFLELCHLFFGQLTETIWQGSTTALDDDIHEGTSRS
jgi:hypothetical protein